MSSPSPTPNRVQTKQRHGLAFRKVVAWMSVERDVEEPGHRGQTIAVVQGQLIRAELGIRTFRKDLGGRNDLAHWCYRR